MAGPDFNQATRTQPSCACYHDIVLPTSELAQRRYSSNEHSWQNYTFEEVNFAALIGGAIGLVLEQARSLRRRCISCMCSAGCCNFFVVFAPTSTTSLLTCVSEQPESTLLRDVMLQRGHKFSICCSVRVANEQATIVCGVYRCAQRAHVKHRSCQLAMRRQCRTHTRKQALRASCSTSEVIASCAAPERGSDLAPRGTDSLRTVLSIGPCAAQPWSQPQAS